MSDPLFRLWEATVERAPSAVGVIDAATGRAWTRRELLEGARRRAGAFAVAAGKTGLRGRRVALSVPNGAEWFHVFMGLMAAGAVPAPVDPSEPAEAQRRAAHSIGAAFLLLEGRLGRLGKDGEAPSGRFRPPQECLVKLTSGSTGAPKGLSATHAQMAADGRQICASMGIGPDDVNLATIPLGYSYGLGNLVVPLMLQGTCVVCAPSALPHALGADALRFAPTVFPAVPPVLKALAASDLPRSSLASLRLVISAGSPLSPDLARAFADKFGIRVHGFYGTSETGGISFDRSGDATLGGRSVGTPLAGVRIEPRDSGRFTVSGAAVLGRGRFSPADRGAFNPEGELCLLGRSDRVVKVAGRRVDLAEIEAALRAVPGVRDALAHLGEGADAVLAAAVATELSPSEVRRRLRAHAASWKIPARIVALPEFPVTSRGKTDSRKLRQLLSEPRTTTSISTLSAARQISAPR
ncbi:MAG TPA: class I adenylate-forming enzyme family protein [Opitutaceae bacterium]